MSQSLRKIIWAIEPFPVEESLEKNTALQIEHFTRGAKVSVEPCCHITLDPTKTTSKEDCLSSIENRIKSYQLPGFESVHFIISEQEPSIAEKTKKVFDFSKNRNADLIVLQTKAKSGLERLFIGSFTETFILESNIPTLTINPVTPIIESNKILFLTDFSSQSKNGFKKVLTLAKEMGLEIIVFHWVQAARVPFNDIDNPGTDKLEDIFTQDLIDDSKASYKELKLIADQHSVPTTYTVKSGKGNPSEEISKFAEASKVRLVSMVGTSNSFSAFLLGSLTRQMVRTSKAPVWTIHL